MFTSKGTGPSHEYLFLKNMLATVSAEHYTY